MLSTQKFGCYSKPKSSTYLKPIWCFSCTSWISIWWPCWGSCINLVFFSVIVLECFACLCSWQAGRSLFTFWASRLFWLSPLCLILEWSGFTNTYCSIICKSCQCVLRLVVCYLFWRQYVTRPKGVNLRQSIYCTHTYKFYNAAINCTSPGVIIARKCNLFKYVQYGAFSSLSEKFLKRYTHL